MLEMRVRLTEDGNIAIPAEYLQALGLHVGDEIILRLENADERLFTLRRAMQQSQEIVRRHNPKGRSLVDELIAERRREAELE